jgi:very-short-patch-repair endonuclease
VTRAQLVAAGLRRGAIAHRVAERRLHPVHRGVYLVGHPVPAPLAREMAAVLACGIGAALSHHWAAAVWELRPPARGAIDVTVAGRNPGLHRGIRIHRVRRLDPLDVRRYRAIAVTAPARTLLDLGEVVPRHHLERAIAEGLRRRLIETDQLLDLLGRSPGRRGGAALRELLNHDPAFTRSEAEVRLLALLRAAGIPPTDVNVRLGRHEVDFLWREQRLVVEFDGYAYHSTRAAFERDRGRDADLQAAGYRVMRVTWRQLIETPEAVVARIAQALATGVPR